MHYNEICRQLLLANEEIKYQFTVSKKFVRQCFIAWVIISFCLLFLFGLGILTFFLSLFYCYFYLPRANIYIFTNQRVLIRKGWLSTKSQSVPHSKITDTSVKEPFLSKGYGTLTINTAGMNTKFEIVLNNIDNPYEAQKALIKIIGK